MMRPSHRPLPDYPLAGPGWYILALFLVSWAAFIGVAGSIVALIALAG